MSDVTTLGISVDLRELEKATEALAKFEKAAQKAEEAAKKIGAAGNAADDTGDAVSEYGESADGAAEATDSLGESADEASSRLSFLHKVLLGFVSLQTVQLLTGMADRMQMLNNQIKLVTGSESEAIAVRKELLEIANRTYASLEASGSLYVKASRALEAYGYSQQKVLQFVEATNNAMRVGGVGAQEQAAAIFQLSQALGSGRLQGDEFRSISEAAPIMLDILAKHLNKTRAEIRALASEGQLTSQVMVEAMTGAGAMLEEQASKMTVTLGGAITVLQNNFAELANETMNSSGAMSGVAYIVKMLADNLDVLAAAALSVALVYAGRYVSSLAAAAAAKRGMIALNMLLIRAELAAAASAGAAAAAQTALAMAGRGLLALFGGPAGLIFAGTAIVGTWAAMDVHSRKLAESIRDQRKPVSELVEEYNKLNTAQKQVALLDVNKSLNTATVEAARSKAQLRDLLLGDGMSQYANNQKQPIRRVYEELTSGALDAASALEKLRQLGGYSPEKLKQVQDAIAAYQGYASDVRYAEEQQAALNGTLGATKTVAGAGTSAIQNLTRTLDDYIAAAKQARAETEKLMNRWAGDDEYKALVLEYRKQGHSSLVADRMAQAGMATKGAYAFERMNAIYKARVSGESADAVNAELRKIEDSDRARERPLRRQSYGRGGENPQMQELKEIQSTYERTLADLKRQWELNKVIGDQLIEIGGASQYTALRDLNLQFKDTGNALSKLNPKLSEHKKAIENLKRAAGSVDSQSQLLGILNLGANYKKRFADMKFEIELFGKTTKEADRLRFARELDLKAAEMARGMSPQNVAALEAERRSYMALYDEILRHEKSRKEAYGNNWIGGIEDGARRFMDSAGTMRDQFADMTESTMQTLADGLGTLAATGKLNFRDMTVSILQNLSKIFMHMAVMRLVGSVVGNLFPLGPGWTSAEAGYSSIFSGVPYAQASGGAWQNGVQFFANGGVFTNRVVNHPTMFAHGGGFGVMGEAGPEAIMPLTRGPNGKLGVMAHGSGGGMQNNIAITVNVDNNGQAEQTTQADGEAGRRLAQAIEAKVIEVITREQAYGGLLHG